MLGRPDSQSETAVNTGCMVNKLFGHSLGVVIMALSASTLMANTCSVVLRAD